MVYFEMNCKKWGEDIWKVLLSHKVCQMFPVCRGFTVNDDQEEKKEYSLFTAAFMMR